MVKCEVLSDLQLRGSCLKDSDGSDFLYLPIIIIATVGIIVATVSIGFAVKVVIKHFTDNGVHNIESSQSTSRYKLEIVKTKIDFTLYLMRIGPAVLTLFLLPPLQALRCSHRRGSRDGRIFR